MELQVRVQSVPTDGIGSDDALGERLVSLLHGAVQRGGAPASAMVVTPDRIDIVPLRPVVEAKMRPGLFLAGLSRGAFGSEAPIAVGLIGTFTWRRTREDAGIPLVMTFLEWADCRWWQWRALVDPGASPLAIRHDTETTLRAVDGAARPDGLGGWWSLGRRRPVDLRWRRTDPVVYH
jgi:hypothetical protein